MRLGEILDRLEQLSPASFAMDWDNSGFLLGDRDAEIQRVLISVDVTKDVIREAIENDRFLELKKEFMDKFGEF